MADWIQLSDDIFVNLSEVHAVVFDTDEATNGARIYLAGETLTLGKNEAESLRKVLESKPGNDKSQSGKVYSW